MIMGPFAAFEHLAIVDYLAQNKMPTFGYAGAEDVTQRKANPYIVRTSNSAAQCMLSDGRLCREGTEAQARDHGVRRLRLRSRTGRRLPARLRGCRRQASSRKSGRRWRRRTTRRSSRRFRIATWSVGGLTGANPLRFMKQIQRSRPQAAGGRRLDLRRRLDHAQLRRRSHRACTVVDPVFAGHRHDEQQALPRLDPQILRQRCRHRPLQRGLLRQRQILEKALEKTGGKTRRSGRLHQGGEVGYARPTRRAAPISFDEYGNIIVNFYIRRAEKQDGKIVNKTRQDLSERLAVLDLRSEEFLQQPGLFARLSADEELSGTHSSPRLRGAVTDR